MASEAEVEAAAKAVQAAWLQEDGDWYWLARAALEAAERVRAAAPVLNVQIRKPGDWATGP
jgi:hypothetical protein